MNDQTDFDTNHDDVTVMRLLLQRVKGLSWTSTSTPVFELEDEQE